MNRRFIETGLFWSSTTRGGGGSNIKAMTRRLGRQKGRLKISPLMFASCNCLIISEWLPSWSAILDFWICPKPQKTV